jgi:hypothetical protein
VFSVFFYSNLPDIVTSSVRTALADSSVDWPDSDASDDGTGSI